MKDKWRDLFGAEWDWVVKLGACISDPEEKKSFWETVRDKKLADSSYSIYDDFPRSENATKRAMDDCCRSVFSRRKLRKEEESA